MSTVQVTSAFSATYENYKIIVSGGVGSGVQNIGMYLGTSAPASGYFSNRIKNAPNNGTVGGNGLNNQSSWGYAAQAGTNFINLNMDVMSPFAAKYTIYNGLYLLDNGADSEIGTTAGFLNNTTSYTAFTLTPSGTLTGGTVYVYGYGAS